MAVGRPVPLFQEDTGLNAKQLYTTPLVRPPDPDPGTRRDLLGALPTNTPRPAALAAQHLARPAQFPDGKDGAIIDEDPAEWGVRVMLEIANAGLYDPNTGEWVDVLARAGVDLNGQAGVDRVTAWVRGEADELLLDSFTIADQLDHAQPAGWAREAARAEAWAMREAQWSRTANALLLFIEANPDEQPPTTLAKIVAETAAACFTDIAVDPETGRTMPWRSPGTHSKPPTWTTRRTSSAWTSSSTPSNSS